MIAPTHIDGLHNPANLGTKFLPAEPTAWYTAYILDSAGDHVLWVGMVGSVIVSSPGDLEPSLKDVEVSQDR